MRDAPRRRRWSWGFSFLTYISPLTLYYMGHSFAGASVYVCVWGDAESKVTHKRMWIGFWGPFKSKSTREKGHSIYCFTVWILLGYNSASTYCCLLWPFYLWDEPTNRNMAESIGSNMEMPKIVFKKKSLVAYYICFRLVGLKLMVY